jgi:hypothetical protein
MISISGKDDWGDCVITGTPPGILPGSVAGNHGISGIGILHPEQDIRKFIELRRCFCPDSD